MTKLRPPAAAASGFTLIELLLVIAIVALLVSMALPGLGSARDQARTTVCQSNLRQMGVASLAYSNDYKGFFSSGPWDNRRLRSLGPIDRVGWVADQVDGGFLKPGHFLCPTSPARGSETWNPSKVRQGDVWQVFTDEQQIDMLRAGFNTNYTQSWYMGFTEPKTVRQITDPKDITQTRGPLRESALSFAPPHKVPLFGDTKAEELDTNNWLLIDGRRVTGAKTVSDGPTAARTPNGQGVSGRQVYTDFGPAHGRGSFVVVGQIRHNKNVANMVFADGSVTSLLDNGKRDGVFESTQRRLDNGWTVRVYDDIEGLVYGGWLTQQGLNW
jgi:prepilin-type N-terminal cleavage/methylation domain-containing protein/prepilin-type processing-associated H-X9-DG protein